MFCHSLSSSWPRNLSSVLEWKWDRTEVVVEWGMELKLETRKLWKEHNSYFANSHLHSNTSSYFSLTPGIPLLWSTTRLNLATSREGACMLWNWWKGLLGNWWHTEEKKVAASLCSSPAFLLWGTDVIRRFATKKQKRISSKWQWQLVQQAATFLLEGFS